MGPLQVHASPASAADVSAAEAALRINAQVGERLRARLLRLVRRLRRGLARLGMPLAAGSCLPVQSVGPLPRAVALRLADRMARCGIHTVLLRPETGPGLLLTWVITARHRDGDIARALAALAAALGRARPGRPARRCLMPSPDDSPIMVIDSHCHAGKGDGLAGPWDTDAPLGHYARRAAAAGITRTVLYPAFNSDYARANRMLARIVSRPARRDISGSPGCTRRPTGAGSRAWCETR